MHTPYPECLVISVEGVTYLWQPSHLQVAITCSFSLEELHQLHLHDNTVGQLLRAKETNHKPSNAYEKSQYIEYHRLSQQWD